MSGTLYKINKRRVRAENDHGRSRASTENKKSVSNTLTIASEIRTAFNKSGGALGETNSVSFNFDRVGRIAYPADAADADTMFEAALEAGANDVVSSEDEHEIFCAPDDFSTVQKALEVQYPEPNEAKLSWRAQNTIELDENKAAILLKFLDVLDDNDDVQSVAANFDISDEIMEKLAE